jgi:hypothetical protein
VGRSAAQNQHLDDWQIFGVKVAARTVNIERDMNFVEERGRDA